MKLWHGLSAGVLALGLSSASVAEAQWAPEHGPAYDPHGYDERGYAGYASPWHQQVWVSHGSLAEHALHFAEMLEGIVGYQHVTDDAFALAEAARHFQEEVMKGSSREHLIDDFREVQAAYRHLYEEFSRAHGTHHIAHLNDDWSAMTQAYASTLHTMQIVARGRRHHYQYEQQHYYPAPGYVVPRRQRRYYQRPGFYFQFGVRPRVEVRARPF